MPSSQQKFRIYVFFCVQLNFIYGQHKRTKKKSSATRILVGKENYYFFFVWANRTTLKRISDWVIVRNKALVSAITFLPSFFRRFFFFFVVVVGLNNITIFHVYLQLFFLVLLLFLSAAALSLLRQFSLSLWRTRLFLSISFRIFFSLFKCLNFIFYFPTFALSFSRNRFFFLDSARCWRFCLVLFFLYFYNFLLIDEKTDLRLMVGSLHCS